MEIKPIRNDADLQAAYALIEKLWYAEEGSDDAFYLDLLTYAVEKYEDTHYHIERPHPVDMITFHMDMRGYTKADLDELLGSETIASEILSKKRKLTLDMIGKISKAWSIPLALLLPENDVELWEAEGAGESA